MTYQVKEGDVLEYRGDGGSKSSHSLTIGKRYTVNKSATGLYKGLYIVADSGEWATVIAKSPSAFGFHLVTTPPATIQHEGYNYTRGEPIVPEWVKDGAWVVHKESGELHQLFEDSPGYFKAVNKKTRHPFVLDFHPSMSLSDVFRPFTNEDWKWGMWAEYQGEKVFVNDRIDNGVTVSKPSNPYFYIPFSEITPTTAP